MDSEIDSGDQKVSQRYWLTKVCLYTQKSTKVKWSRMPHVNGHVQNAFDWLQLLAASILIAKLHWKFYVKRH